MAKRTVAWWLVCLTTGLVAWKCATGAPAGQTAGGLHWRGAASCSAASCHGGGGPPGSKGSEYTTWAACDPHSRAYQVLFDERSQRIVKNLFSLAELRLAHAEKVTLCLACHVAPEVHGPAGATECHLADGVSCESCHGPAQLWLTQHYLPSWKQTSPAQREALGFRPTKDLVTRARLCAGCHVGAGERDVNHDLLAAGHPRLAFEFAGYQGIYPRHWSGRDDRARYPDLEARSWALGQAVSAQAALDLLAHRAANESKPWPEFAELNCSSCHRNLGPKVRGDQRALRGEFRWNDWYYAELAPAFEFGAIGLPLPAELKELGREMARRLPDRRAEADLAGKASVQLEDWLRQAAKTPPTAPNRLQAWMRDEVGRMNAIPLADWDRAAQNYLAVAALHFALKDGWPKFEDPPVHAALCQRRRALQLPPGSNCPRRLN
jgi:hypothetical protein